MKFESITLATVLRDLDEFLTNEIIKQKTFKNKHFLVGFPVFLKINLQNVYISQRHGINTQTRSSVLKMS